jgi:hypothetical protein
MEGDLVEADGVMGATRSIHLGGPHPVHKEIAELFVSG